MSVSDDKYFDAMGTCLKKFAAFCLVLLWPIGVINLGIAQERTYIPTRTAAGEPDLNGIWQANNNAHWDIEAHSASAGPVLVLGALGAMPGGMGIVEGDNIPYLPDALATRNEHFANRLDRDPAIKCYLPGVPRATYMPYPFQIIQGAEHIMIVHEFAGAVRTIYMNEHTAAPADSWMGWSNGHWDGNTLVIETEGFNGMTWFDRAGNHHSDALRVVERITRRSEGTLIYEATMEDPNTFSRSWTIRMPLYKRIETNAEILEFRCVEFVEDLIYGQLQK